MRGGVESNSLTIIAHNLKEISRKFRRSGPRCSNCASSVQLSNTSARPVISIAVLAARWRAEVLSKGFGALCLDLPVSVAS